MVVRYLTFRADANFMAGKGEMGLPIVIVICMAMVHYEKVEDKKSKIFHVSEMNERTFHYLQCSTVPLG